MTLENQLYARDLGVGAPETRWMAYERVPTGMVGFDRPIAARATEEQALAAGRDYIATYGSCFTERKAVGTVGRRGNPRLALECLECGKKFASSKADPSCPKCGGSDVEVR